MSKLEHQKIIEHGVGTWNEWRRQNPEIFPNLLNANLSGVTLVGIDFSKTNLYGANLGEANFRNANLKAASLANANLNRATLEGANLHGAYLRDANLSEVDFSYALLHNAHLHSADFYKAIFFDTIFSNTGLADARNLDSCIHRFPSTIDYRTLAKSGNLPLPFLRGCGLNDWEIEATKLYNKELTSSQITDILYRIDELRVGAPLQFHSCFISYSQKDEDFARRLHSDLQDSGVRCWFAPEDLKIGMKIRNTIDETIRVYDKLLIILSEHSVMSSWVEHEVEAAFDKEIEQKRSTLFPIRLDDSIMEIKLGWAAKIKRERHIGDFRDWKDDEHYKRAFARLLDDLKTGSTK